MATEDAIDNGTSVRDNSRCCARDSETNKTVLNEPGLGKPTARD